jgi:hypothetical protein
MGAFKKFNFGIMFGLMFILGVCNFTDFFNLAKVFLFFESSEII